MSDDTIQIGENHYTPAQIQVINELFGEGFLEANPHFPHRGDYVSGSHKYWGDPELLQERQRKEAKKLEEQRLYAEEQERPQIVILEACAELSGTMGRHEEQIIARVIGESKNDARIKFVREHLQYTGDDWQGEYKKWISSWHYERFVTDVTR